MTPQQTWREEFDSKFELDLNGRIIQEEVKEFMASLLTAQLNQVLAVAPEEKRTSHCGGCSQCNPDWDEGLTEGFNEGVALYRSRIEGLKGKV